MYAQNHLYGHLAILAGYCGVPAAGHLLGYLQHGWTPSRGINQCRTPRVPAFVWSERNAQHPQWTEEHRPVHAIGAPFLYLDAMMAYSADGERELPSPRPTCPYPSKTVAFPFHGIPRRGVVGSHGEYAEHLAEVEGPGVRVYLHLKEFRQERTRLEYERFGHSVHCNFRTDIPHSAHDPLLLLRQRELLLRTSRVVSNRFMTAIAYAAYLGCQIAIYGPFHTLSGSSPQSNLSIQSIEWPVVPESGLSAAESVAIGRRELGHEYMKSPNQLRSLLGWNKRKSVTLAGYLHKLHELRTDFRRDR